MICLGILASFVVAQGGLVREGQRTFGGQQHTRFTAVASNIVIATLTLIGIADILRALWRGGGLVRGKAASAHLELTAGPTTKLAEVRLRPREGLLVQIVCRRASAPVLRFSLVATDSTETDPDARPVASLRLDFAWEAEKHCSGVLRPRHNSLALDVSIRLDMETAAHADLSIRWWPTLALSSPTTGKRR